MATRVFQLAKELGVTSKLILDKCRAEGIDLKNHMATLSAGLEATIREWFTEGATVTAIETAESVDIEHAREEGAKQRRRRRKKDEVESPDEPAIAVSELPAGQESLVADESEEVAVEPLPAEEPIEQLQPVAQEPVAQEPAAPEVVDEEPVTAEPAPAEAPAAPEEPRGVPNKPASPKVIGPAGPQLIPRPAQLQGPRVVRVEKPDFVRPPTRRPGPGAQPPPQPMPVRGATPLGRKPISTTGEEEEGGGEAAKKAKRRSPRRKAGRTVESGEGIREWRDRDLTERRERLAAASTGGLRRHRASVRRPGAAPALEHEGPLEVEEPITIKKLSAAIGAKSADLMKKLMTQGRLIGINQAIDAETAELLAAEYGLSISIRRQRTALEQLEDSLAAREKGSMEPRPPVVAFLGHVDHGKTSLLDRIRTKRVVDTESGGITQHIGSYRYEKNGKVVAFLDTPGHEAFTQMRSRGANMTDVVVLVVAADDGVMPQTAEAINHAKAAGVPIVVALNKIDLPNANETRVLGQLAEHDLQPRAWGGKTEVVRTSAATGEGIDDLVEVLSLEAELLELKAEVDAPASGSVIEAEMDPGRGVVARVLVQNGTLKLGDVLLAGPGYGRVRQLLDDQGREITSAGPSTPVEVSGLDVVPTAGDRFFVLEDFSKAKSIAEEYRSQQREKNLATKQKVTLDNLFTQISAGDVHELPLIVKADVQGSVEVLVASLNKLSTDEVRVKVLHAAVGGISSSDVLLAEASHAIILGFHVVPDAAARMLAEDLGVDIRMYRVIYELTDQVRKAMEGLLEPEIKEQVLGHAEVRNTFKVSRVGTIAGCYVTDGTVQRNAKLRIIRDSIVIEDERLLESLKRFKDDAREVRNGMECGIKIAGYDDVKVGDVLEAYTTVEVSRSL